MGLSAERIRAVRAQRIAKGEMRIRSGTLGAGFWRDGLRSIGAANGARVTNAYSQHDWTYVAINAVAKAIQGVPAVVKKGPRSKDAKPENGPWQTLFDSPCPILTRAQFWAATTIYCYLTRGCYWYMIGKTKPVKPGEMPVELWPLPASAFEAFDAQGRPLVDRFARAAKYRLTLDGFTRMVEAHQVAQLKFFDPTSPLFGFLPTMPAESAINFGFAAEGYGAATFVNGCAPGGWIKVPGSPMKTQRDQILSEWNDEHRGPSKAGKWALLMNGADVVLNPNTMKDMEFIEGQKYARDTVLQVFGVPKAVVGITDDLNYATHVGQQRVFYENTIGPQLADYADAIYAQVIKPVEDDVWVDFELSQTPAMQSDFSARIDMATKLVGLGWTPDDANERLDMSMPSQAAAEEAAAAVAGGAPVAETAMNGAQVSSLVDVIAQVSAGLIPAEAATSVIVAAFPTISPESAAAMTASAAALANAKAPAPAPTPTAPPNQAPPEAPRAASILIRRNRTVITDRVGYVKSYVRGVVFPQQEAMRRAMRSYLATLTKEQKARFDSWMRSKGLGMDAVYSLTPDDMRAILVQSDVWAKKLREVATPVVVKTMGDALQAAADETGSIAIPVGDPRITDLGGRLIGTLIDSVPQTTIKRVRAQLLAASAKGETIAEMQARLSGVFSGNQARALLIARTETGIASSNARFEQMKDAEIESHEWVDSGGPAVRASHQACNGKVRKLGEAFPNGLLYPHQFGADPSEVCNCACEALAVV